MRQGRWNQSNSKQEMKNTIGLGNDFVELFQWKPMEPRYGNTTSERHGEAIIKEAELYGHLSYDDCWRVNCRHEDLEPRKLSLSPPPQWVFEKRDYAISELCVPFICNYLVKIILDAGNIDL